MSKRNIAKMNKYLDKGMKMSDVSKHLKIDVKTLQHFAKYTPKKAAPEVKETPAK